MPPKKAPKEEKKALLGRPSNNLKMGIVGMPNVGKSSLFNVIAQCGKLPVVPRLELSSLEHGWKLLSSYWAPSDLAYHACFGRRLKVRLQIIPFLGYSEF
jgi:hypothetical protein